MMNDLNWKPLQTRRRENRLVLLYKIVNNLVAIPPDKHLELKFKKGGIVLLWNQVKSRMEACYSELVLASFHIGNKDVSALYTLPATFPILLLIL